MQLGDLDETLVRAIVADDNPQVARVRIVATPDQPNNHTRLQIDFADGSSAYVMVAQVAGPGVARHAAYEIPAGVV